MTRRVSIVSDASFYVGPNLARLLAERGHDLVVGDAPEELVAELSAAGATVENVTGVRDLAQPDASTKLVQATLDRFGRIDSATAFTGRIVVGRFLKSSIEDMRAVNEGCIEAPYNFLRTVVPQMVEQGDGQVLVLTSAAGARPTPGAPLYSSARAGANMLVRNVAAEVAASGVQVNAVGTNFMDFPGFLAANRVTDAESRARVEGMVPMKRLGTMDELAHFCATFVDGRSRFTTGQFVAYAGGWGVKLGLMLGYWAATPPPDLIDAAKLAESCGYDSVWTAEAYGSDVVSPLCWIGANTSTIKLGTGLMQISARTPACAAMTAASIDHLSNGRLILGLGVSGPQVVEGWYGQPFPKPLARTREYVEIIRKMLRREGPVTNDGEHYPLPYPGGTKLGKPLKMTVHPLRNEIPIFLGAEGPRNVQMTTEIADGWLPIFYSPYRNDMYEGISFPEGFEVACPVTMMVTDDVEGGLGLIKMSLSFYIGGMGAKDRNFHLDVVSRMGFGGEARKVQELFMDGKRDEAVAAVPDALADEISLVGPPERIRDRLQAWAESPVTTLLVGAREPETIRLLPELLA